MKKLAVVLVIGTSLLLVQSGAFAQKSETPASGATVSEQDIELLRSDIRSTKKQIIADNMKLTGAQAEKFWPVYDAYAQETTKLGDARYALIKEYANHYEDMTDARSRKPRQQNGNVGRANCDRAPAVDSEVREGAYRKTECIVLSVGPAHHSATRSAVCRKHSACQVAPGSVCRTTHTAIAPSDSN